MSALKSSTQVLSGVGYGAFVPIYIANPFALPPGFLCILSPGAVLTYTIECTGDDTSVAGYNAAAANVNPVDDAAGLTASYNGALSACVMGLRPHITSYTSGFLTFQVIQSGL